LTDRLSGNRKERKKMKSEKIKALRLSIPETQAEFAVRIGVNVATISRWENGHYPPRPASERLLSPGEEP